jgi:hypothetical protein
VFGAGCVRDYGFVYDGVRAHVCGLGLDAAIAWVADPGRLNEVWQQFEP